MTDQHAYKTKTQLPAGEYYIGDVLHQLPDEVYEYGKLEGTYEGHHYAYSSTKWGDGVFDTNSYMVFAVDSGTIGVVSAEMAVFNEERNRKSEEFVVFTEPFDFSFDEKTGIIKIGPLEIYTDDDMYFDENDEYIDIEIPVVPEAEALFVNKGVEEGD